MKHSRELTMGFLLMRILLISWDLSHFLSQIPNSSYSLLKSHISMKTREVSVPKNLIDQNNSSNNIAIIILQKFNKLQILTSEKTKNNHVA